MSSAKSQILNRLKAARRPFEDARPTPQHYLPVTQVDATDAEALLARFTTELEHLKGQVFVVDGDEAACTQILALLHSHQATHILHWDFAHIPVAGLHEAMVAAGIAMMQPETHIEQRRDPLEEAKRAQVGLTGADAAAATTGTVIVSTGPGKGRLPTILAPVHIAVITLNQLLPRIEDWLARERAAGSQRFTHHSNVCFITGPSRTGDIEMQLVLGVHGPGIVQVVVKR